MKDIHANTHICLVRCKFNIGTAMQILDVVKYLSDKELKPSFPDNDFDFSFKVTSCDFNLIKRYNAIAKYSFQSLFDSMGSEEDLFLNSNREEYLNANSRKLLIIEFHSFVSSAEQYIEISVDTLAFSYVSIALNHLVKTGKQDFCFFFSGMPQTNNHFTCVSNEDYYSVRAFMFFQTIYGANDYFYFLNDNDKKNEPIWKRLYSDPNVSNILNKQLETKDIFNDGFGKILPLIRIDEENYKLLQVPAYSETKDTSLLRRRYKDLLKNYTSKLSDFLSVEQKTELNSCLLADNLFEALFFTSSLYYLFVTYQENMGDLGIFHEQCMDYVQGLYQLIENTFFHVVSGVRKGFGNLSFRIRENKNTEQPKYTYEIYITDSPYYDSDCLGIVDTFRDNFKELADAKIILRDFFEEGTNAELASFLDNNNNIAYHYGLQILNNTILTYNGSLSVRSGKGSDNFYCSQAELANTHINSDPWPWHFGTAYRIYIPIDHHLKSINHQDSIAIKNHCASMLPDTSKDFCSINQIIDSMPIDISFISSLQKVEYVERKLNILKTIPTGTSIPCTAEKFDADTIYKIDCCNLKTETQFEIVAKIAFLCLTRYPNLNNIALINLNTKYSVIKLFRQFALFYNRYGQRAQLNSKCVFIVDSEAKLMLYLRGQINDIIADMQNLQIIGGMDETAMSIVGHLGEKNRVAALSIETRKFVNSIRSKYLQIEIGKEEQKEKIWIKQLNNILNSDIHKKPFGCNISDTHVKIGDIHIDTFYEAEILFSHHYWVNQFVLWLYDEIYKYSEAIAKPTVIIGYETYIEPVLYSLQQKAKKAGIGEVYYGIYENPKYSQNQGYFKTGRNIRYIDSLRPVINSDTNLIFLCGVSTTLNTFRKMFETLQDQLGMNCNLPFPNSFLSLIQILPKSQNNTIDSNGRCKLFEIKNEKLDDSIEDNYNFRFSIVPREKYAISEKINCITITSKYLTSVYCNWYPADSCKLCALDGTNDLFNELPIISTNESSVVPSQMIESKDHKGPECPYDSTCKIDLFDTVKIQDKNTSKYKIKYVFENYLYYGHMDRMDHHYIYYVRTAHLIKHILDNTDSIYYDKFKDICDNIKQELFKTGKEYVDIIVFPADSGDEVFPTAINHRVFNDQAHMLAVEPNKEFRSNFGTKHSNISYFIEQTQANAKEDKLEIRFHYVSKQLIASETFSRIKSLVTSLMHTPNSEKDRSTSSSSNNDSNKEENENNSVIFSDVIVFLSRHSEHSKRNYISDTSKYFSFIDVAVPSIRYYGDACPMCKMSLEATSYKNASLLKINANYWEEKEEKYQAKPFDKLKNMNNGYRPHIRERYFRRFYFENQLFRKFKTCYSTDDYLSVMGNIISPKGEKTDVEDVIALIKVVSSPFLFYRENEKKAALKFILAIFNQYLHYDGIINVPFNTHGRKIYFKNPRSKYVLLVICLNSLAKMDSTALLSIDRILDLCETVESILPYALSYRGYFKDDNGEKIPGFYSCIIFNCKRIICGISGESRAIAFERDIISHLKDHIGSNSFFELFLLTLLLDNISTPPDLENNSFADIIEKYTTGLTSQITKGVNITCRFVYMENDLIEVFGDSHLNTYEKDEIKHLIKKSYSSPRGFEKNKSKCAVYICSAYNEHSKVDSSMFLLFDFDSREISIDDYLAIRQCLSFRSSLVETIMPDLINNTIKDAFSARAAVRLMSSRKAVNHSGFEDVFDQSQTIGFLINSWHKSNEDEKEEYFKNTCQMINSFMGRCIAINGTQNFIKEYYDKQNGTEVYSDDSFDNTCLSLAPQDNDISHFNLAAEPCDYSNSKVSLDFLKEYLKELFLTEKSKYWGSYRNVNQFKPINDGFTVNLFVNNMITSRNVQINLVEKTDEEKKEKELDKQINNMIIKPIADINILPSFLNQSSTDSHQPNIHFLVGILDTLIRNVYKHSNCNHVDVCFAYDSNSYSFEIKNSIVPQSNKAGTGLTEQFFISLNSLKHNKQDDYTITMDPVGKEFIAVIKVQKNKEVI